MTPKKCRVVAKSLTCCFGSHIGSNKQSTDLRYIRKNSKRLCKLPILAQQQPNRIHNLKNIISDDVIDKFWGFWVSESQKISFRVIFGINGFKIQNHSMMSRGSSKLSSLGNVARIFNIGTFFSSKTRSACSIWHYSLWSFPIMTWYGTMTFSDSKPS